MQWIKIIKETFFLLGISVIFAFTVNFFSPAGIAIVGQWNESQGVIVSKGEKNVFSGELEIKDVKTAKQIYDKGQAVFVDARSLKDFENGHIKGAESLPLDQLDHLIQVFKERYPTDTFIVTYCSTRACSDGHSLEQLLFDHGYVNVSIFIDGYQAWKEKGYPIENQTEKSFQ